MPGLSKVIVLDPDARARRQVQLGFEREGIPTAAAEAEHGTENGTARGAENGTENGAENDALGVPGDDAGLVLVGGVDGRGVELIRRARGWLDGRGIDAPVVFTGRGVEPRDATAAGADEVVRHPAYLRDVVTIARLLRGRPADQRDHVVGNLIEHTGVFSLVRALSTLGRSATLTLVRGLRRGEVRFYFGEVTSAQVGLIHGQAALHQLLLWTDARFDFHHEDVVRRQQIPMSRDELFADAERFLEGVRDSAGRLSPAMLLEQDLPRVQSLAKQIPTEVYGVLRMFDGHRTLADVLEDSPYRVFETLRVAQRAVEAGLIRVVDKPPPRPGWRTLLAIEDWLVGGDLRDALAVQDARPATIRDARGAPAPQTPGGGKSGRKRRKKKRRTDTPPAVPIRAAPRDIDWGALVPRIVGAEVGPLAGVVPASHVSGEIASAPADTAVRAEPAAAAEPTIVFDEAADRVAAERAAAERAAAERAEADRIAAERAEAEAEASRAVAATVSVSAEPARVIDALPLDDTKPERPAGKAARATEATEATVASPAEPPAEDAVIVADTAVVSTDAITAPMPAVSPAPDAPDATPPADAADAEPATPVEVIAAEPSGPILELTADPAPTEVVDEPSDGVVRHHIATAETAPVKRRQITPDPRDDDRPGDTTGEITMPRPRPPVVIRYSEPTILVPELAAIQAELGEQLPTVPIAPHATSAPTTAAHVTAAPSAAVPSAAAPSAAAAHAPTSARSSGRDSAPFNAIEEAFFQAGHDKLAHGDTESFDDLDEGYRPLGFWERLTGRGKPDRRARPEPRDKPEARDKPEPRDKPDRPDKRGKPDR